MNIWKDTVLTDKGAALQAKLLSGQTLKITGAKAGTGSVPAVNLRRQTDVIDGREDITLQPARTEADQTVIPVLLENKEIVSGYELWQIGFYAEDPDEGEILYCIAQASKGKDIPAASESPGFSITWDFYFQTSNTAPFEVVVNSKGLVNIEEYQIHSQEIENLKTVIGNYDNLQTQEKTNLVEAVNETNVNINNHKKELERINSEIQNRYTKAEIESKLSTKINQSAVNQYYVASGDKSLASKSEITAVTFTTPENGIYDINANSYFATNNSGTYRQLDILRNGSSQGVMSNIPLNGLGTRVLNTKIIPLNKGDVLAFVLRQNSGSTLTCSVYVNILGIHK